MALITGRDWVMTGSAWEVCMARFIRTLERRQERTEFSSIGRPLGQSLNDKLCRERVEASWVGSLH